jgi:hypothetical protein
MRKVEILCAAAYVGGGMLAFENVQFPPPLSTIAILFVKLNCVSYYPFSGQVCSLPLNHGCFG